MTFLTAFKIAIKLAQPASPNEEERKHQPFPFPLSNYKQNCQLTPRSAES